MGFWKSPAIFVVLWLGLNSCPACAQETFEDLFRMGDQAFQSGDNDQAVKYFQQAIELNPNFAPVYNSLGLAQSARNAKLSDVVWCFKMALDIDPKYAEAYANLCRVYYDAGELESGEKACLSALEIDPNLGHAQLSLAWGYLRAGEHMDKAVYYFREVMKRVKHPMVHFGLGLAYVQQGDKVQVLEAITALRGLGRNDLAGQLEQAIRPTDPVPVALPPLPNSQPGQLVGNGVPALKPQPGPDASQPMPMSGFTQIRLRGKLSNTPSAPAVKKELYHPGSLSPSTESNP